MQIFSVSSFISYVNETFKALWDPQEVAIEGEVSGYKVSQGQWVMFDLKDAEALVSIFCPVWKMGIPLFDGARVRVFGLPRVYPKFGKFSLSAERVELMGEGELRKALAALRTRLATEGLFDPTRKRMLPRFPKKVALIASRESAAFGDFVRIVQERWGGLHIDVYHVSVQGERAPREIIRALVAAHQDPTNDVIVLTRGGGSFEELMTFNDEGVARAVFSSKIPTLVAIGHERDVTLAEETADVRGSTPTDSARRLVPDRQDVLYEIATQIRRMEEAVERLIEDGQGAVEEALSASERWRRLIHDARMARQVELMEKAERWIVRWKDRMDTLERLFVSFDPRQVMRRGFAIVRDRSGRVRPNLAGLRPGMGLVIDMRDGTVTALVESMRRSREL